MNGDNYLSADNYEVLKIGLKMKFFHYKTDNCCLNQENNNVVAICSSIVCKIPGNIILKRIMLYLVTYYQQLSSKLLPRCCILDLNYNHLLFSEIISM